MTYQTINPATGEMLESFTEFAPDKLERNLEASVKAHDKWKRTSLAERLNAIARMADLLELERVRLAAQITLEMGKVQREALGEVDKCVTSLRYLCVQFPEWKAQREYRTEQGHEVRLEALGPLLGIMPWNFPLWQVVRFAVPALLCGNTILLKHAPNVWGVAALMGDLFARTLPEGVYQNLVIGVPATEALVKDPRVRGVSLTGSKVAGQRVGALAGAALKTCVLELGGSDAYVILDDADLDLAAKACAAGRLINAGQSCVAAKRFIVTTKNAKAFTERFRAHLADAKHGDPNDEKVKLGPLARRDLRDGLADQVSKSIKAGAKLELGGETPERPGFFYPATLLTNVKPGQPAFDEELFGPVAAVIEAKDETDLFRLANQSIYGLGGAIFSRDLKRARDLAFSELDCGMVAINDFLKSEASVPFGGTKDSGVGRELGREGVFAFVNVKMVKA